MPPQKICIFIPAHNEEENISRVIRALKLWRQTSSLKGHSVDIVLIDDGSMDRTPALAESLGVRVVKHRENLGLGAATRTGLQTATAMGADIAVKFDGDLQYPPHEIDRVVGPLLSNEADLCWGSRFQGQFHYAMPFCRRVGNRLFTWLMNRLTRFKISDAQTGLMAFHRRYFADAQIIGNYNPPQQILLDASRKGMRYREVPIAVYRRVGGLSFVSWKYPVVVVVNILRFYFRSAKSN